MNVRPLADRILVLREKEETMTVSGIIIPDHVAEKPFIGKVVSTGNGKILENGNLLPMSLKVGDRVYFSRYAGIEIKVDETEYLIMREEDVMAVLE